MPNFKVEGSQSKEKAKIQQRRAQDRTQFETNSSARVILSDSPAKWVGNSNAYRRLHSNVRFSELACEAMTGEDP
jgi:hypothetical protein